MIEGLTIAMGLVLAGQTQEAAAVPRPAAESPAARPAEADGWTQLFNGRDLSGWYTFLQKHGKNHDPDGVITIEDGAIHLYKHAAEGSTVVMGYIATEKEYGDYHLRFQYRWGKKKFQPRYALKRDAGLYYHLTGPDAVWPRALQFQIEQTNVGDLIALHGMELDTWIDPATRGAEMPTYQDPDRGGQPRVLGGKGIAYQKRLPGPIEVEGWNTVEVIARGDTTVHRLNGQVVNQGRKIRFLPPEPGASTRPITRGTDRAGDRGRRDRIPAGRDPQARRRSAAVRTRAEIRIEQDTPIGSHSMVLVHESRMTSVQNGVEPRACYEGAAVDPTDAPKSTASGG